MLCIPDLIEYTNTEILLDAEEAEALRRARSDKNINLPRRPDKTRLYQGQNLVDHRNSLIGLNGHKIPQSLINKANEKTRGLIDMIFASSFSGVLAKLCEFDDPTLIRMVRQFDFAASIRNFPVASSPSEELLEAFKRSGHNLPLVAALAMTSLGLNLIFMTVQMNLGTEEGYPERMRRRTKRTLQVLASGGAGHFLLMYISHFFPGADAKTLTPETLAHSFIKGAHEAFFKEAAERTFYCPAHTMLAKELFSKNPLFLLHQRLVALAGPLADAYKDIGAALQRHVTRLSAAPNPPTPR